MGGAGVRGSRGSSGVGWKDRESSLQSLTTQFPEEPKVLPPPCRQRWWSRTRSSTVLNSIHTSQSGRLEPGVHRTPHAGRRKREAATAEGAAKPPKKTRVRERAGPPKTTQAAEPQRKKPAAHAHSKSVLRLRVRDREIRLHEAAHKAGGAGLAVGGTNFTFVVGPDGRRYATHGEVSIDALPVAGNPEATIRKMEAVVRAALAPGHPSATDRAVANHARAVATAARQQLQAAEAAERKAEREGAKAPQTPRHPEHPQRETSAGSSLDVIA